MAGQKYVTLIFTAPIVSSLYLIFNFVVADPNAVFLGEFNTTHAYTPVLKVLHPKVSEYIRTGADP
jgi:hypothetical protein